MSVVLLLVIGCSCIVVGRWMFGGWFNHISLYGGIWSLSLVFFELRLINYYPMESETWFIIFVGWSAFILGAVTIFIAQFFRGDLIKTSTETNTNDEGKEFSYIQVIMEKMLWSLNLISFLAALHGWYVVLKVFGNITNVFAFGSLLYSYRVSEGLPGSIPYISSLALTATLLAGVVTAREGRLKLVAILPLIIVLMNEVTSMGRANLVIAGILFCSGYFFAKSVNKRDHRKQISVKLKRWIALVVACIIVIAGAEFIRSSRGAVETFRGSSTALLNLRKSNFITPSIYLYFTVNFGVLNQYLNSGGEHTPFGGHTLAPLYRLLEKIGFDTHVETYQVRYNTPTGANTGTYLRELHADFGLPGVLFGPYFLGMCSSIFWYRYQKYKNFFDLALLSYLFVVIGMSIFVMATRSGVLLVYLLGALGSGYILDRFQRRASVHRSPLNITS